jgi:hypothetical protein
MKRKKTIDPSTQMMNWYEKAIKQFPRGLISQAQAAIILKTNRMKIARFIKKETLKAVKLNNTCYVSFADVKRLKRKTERKNNG